MAWRRSPRGAWRAVYDVSKALAAEFDYTPYGQAYTANDTVGITHRYTGHDWDSAAALYFAPYRFYNPKIARWMSRDPLGMVDGPNIYAYVNTNPITLVDPLGLTTVEDCDDEYWNVCVPKCRRMPNKTIADKAKRKLCWVGCMADYSACLASVAAERVCDIVREHPVECAVGTIVVIGAVTYIVVTGGAGACTLVPLVAL